MLSGVLRGTLPINKLGFINMAWTLKVPSTRNRFVGTE